MVRLWILGGTALLVLLPSFSSELAADGPSRGDESVAISSEDAAPVEEPHERPLPPSSNRPDLLLITFDTIRADHLSTYGYPWITSPNVDEIAAEGVVFERAYAAIPVTGPSHATLLTGLQPQTHGAYRNGVRMNDHAVSLARILRDAGYQTGAFVSGWTLKSKLTGLDAGFETYSEDFTDRYAMVNSQRPANEVTNAALAWLEDLDPAKPFFLWVHYFDPHEPYEEIRGFEEIPRRPGSEEIEDDRTRKIRRYDSEISFADVHMGRLLQALRKRGLYDDTLVVFAGDHGEAFGEHGYRGHGRRVHEPGIHVPLIIRRPEGQAAGRRVDQLVGLVDVAPTLLELLGAEPLATHQGMSLVPWIDGESPAPVRSRRIHAVSYPGTVGHMPRWVRRIFSRKKPDLPIQMAVLWDDWKYVLLPSKGRAYLYRLDVDPAESQDRLDEHPEFQSVRARLEEWFEATRDEEGETHLTAEDLEHLESLGYAAGGR